MTTGVDFYKFHGAGNDFVMIDNRCPSLEFTVEQVKYFCSRHSGIGADGMILLQNPDSADVSFNMRYFNSDGREASLCGNGSRCAVAFAHYLKMIGTKCKFSAFDGIHSAEIIDYQNYTWNISVSMREVNALKRCKDGFFLDTGSPHFVLFVEDAAETDVFGEGRRWCHDRRFPQGSNIDFCSTDTNSNGIYVRTYERGVEDETLSCGTGVTASALAWACLRHFPNGCHQVPVRTRGGNFQVDFNLLNPRFTDIYLQGPATCPFKGQIQILV